MTLYLLRHVDAVDLSDTKGGRDALRPLSPAGIAKARRIARAFQRLELTFDAVFSSPAVRARRTAEEVLKLLPSADRIKLTEGLALSADPAAILNELSRLRPAPNQVLLVGHEPHLSRLASRLSTSRLSLRLKRGGLVRLSVDRLGPGGRGTLEWIVTPRLWRAMAKKG